MKATLKTITQNMVFPFFIVGLAIIVFLKILENRSIDRLVARNTDLLVKLEKQNELQQLQGEIGAIDGMLRELLESGDSKLGKKLRNKIEAANTSLAIYVPPASTETIENNTRQLIDLLKQRTTLQYNALEAYANNQAVVAEQMISSAKNKELQDRIVSLSAVLMQSQKVYSLRIVNSIRDNGRNVHMWSITLVIAASILCLLVCAHVLAKKRQSEVSEGKAKKAARIKENFLANMSHEIRTPLNAILGFTNILSKTNLDEQQQKHLHIIHSSGNNLLSIVNDILDLSKIEAGMMRIEQAPFRVSDVMATVEDMLSPKAKEKNIQLIVKVDSEVPETLCGDAVRLTQVMINLVSNAIKFTQEGGVYVKVTPFKASGDELQLEFLVRDTGIGISRDKQKFIFERFEQAEAETTRRFGGTGLGLSIVKHLIELQKGTITLNSQEGAGSIFLVVLPYKLTNKEAPVNATKENNQNLHFMNNNVKILVAEDNIMNQQLIKHLLKNWNFKFDLVFNGIQAVEALKKDEYDLVLMDIQMPEMDGHMATRTIRNELRSNIPVIAMTAHAMAGEKEKCLNVGMNDYISKPLNEDDLFNIILRYAKTDNISLGVKAPDKSVINLDYIEQFSENDKDFKREIIREFVTTVPDNIQTMEKAINEKNYTTIFRVAHDMKTTVHFMGLTVLIGHLLQKIEELASSNGALVAIREMFVD
ncbi:MAG TPA: response regulator, partial [Chitinophagaceae bacterium]|nr:response regulator [Chitinophagaceae bacterium]